MSGRTSRRLSPRAKYVLRSASKYSRRLPCSLSLEIVRRNVAVDAGAAIDEHNGRYVPALPPMHGMRKHFCHIRTSSLKYHPPAERRNNIVVSFRKWCKYFTFQANHVAGTRRIPATQPRKSKDPQLSAPYCKGNIRQANAGHVEHCRTSPAKLNHYARKGVFLRSLGLHLAYVSLKCYAETWNDLTYAFGVNSQAIATTGNPAAAL